MIIFETPFVGSWTLSSWGSSKLTYKKLIINYDRNQKLISTNSTNIFPTVFEFSKAGSRVVWNSGWKILNLFANKRLPKSEETVWANVSN